MHVYRWDLDKTYLATEIGSVRGLIRAALEPASRKRSVPGAAALLRGLIDSDPSCRVAIVSGSPTQMRAVLEEKLALDGVRFDSLILKDNLGNLRRGRLRAVTGQLGYKLPQLLKQRVGLGPVVHETLFGDDAEVDALVYALYADVVAGRAGEADVSRVMEAGGAYPDMIEDALHAMRQVGRGEAVEDIFILLDKGTPVKRFQLLGPRLVPVFSWIQAAIVLWRRGRLGTAGVAEVARAVSDQGALSEAGLAGLIQDVVRRRLLPADEVMKLIDQTPRLQPIAAAVSRGLSRLGDAANPPAPPQAREYLAFLKSTRDP